MTKDEKEQPPGALADAGGPGDGAPAGSKRRRPRHHRSKAKADKDAETAGAGAEGGTAAETAEAQGGAPPRAHGPRHETAHAGATHAREMDEATPEESGARAPAASTSNTAEAGRKRSRQEKPRAESGAPVSAGPAKRSKLDRAAVAEGPEARGETEDNDDTSTEAKERAQGDAISRAAAAAARHAGSSSAQESDSMVTDYKALKLNPHVVSALEQDFHFESLTGIQARCIPVALQGRDLLAEAKTGAGKTLAFLIPIVEIVCRSGFRPGNGTAAVIIGPTRELCLQIEGVLLRLLKHFNGSITFLCCIGGQSRSQESYKLTNGVMIVVASPGRLLDHLKLTTDWHTKNLLVLAVDEADRVLDNGFEEDMREIVSLLPKKRQTFLFSATQTTRVEQLARISFQKPPVFISMKSKKDKATVDTLEQGYVMCASEKRLLVLYHFVKRNMKKKMIVFFSSRNSVSFHCELFNYIDVPCVAFHGKQKQHQRSATYMQFCNSPNGVLFTTDVAARGLDIPAVDWIVQFDPPDDPVKYIHRVGRTARAGKCGNALMFLLPQENLFLKYLYDDAKVSVNEYTFDLSKLNNSVQEQLEKLVASNYYLRASARQAYEGYLLAYSSSQLKNVFNVQQLDLAAVAHGFALSDPPPIKMDLSQSAAHMSKKSRHEHRDMRKAKDGKRRAANKEQVNRRHTNISGDWS